MSRVSPLMTDLYELTMAAGYFDQGMDARATFSLYTRHQAQRGFFVAAGLENILKSLESWRFNKAELACLGRTGLFQADFLAWLADLRFRGEVRAMDEGTLFFADEPVLEVTAPIIQAQLLETYLINTMGLASMIATKAARCLCAVEGGDRSVELIDFALRRTQGEDAGLAAARSAYLAGFSATSNVEAGQLYKIPLSGTMAHSFIMTFEKEIDAFRAYARLFPRRTVLLIDTYDTLEGARAAAQVAREMAAEGQRLIGVRLDSGDMVALSRQVRRILDRAGCPEVKIIASGNYDEFRLAEAVKRRAPIDMFGVGTRVGVSADAPFMDMVYKLVRYGGRDVRKLSPGKRSLAGPKQVFRRFDAAGLMSGDWIGHADEAMADAAPLLHPVMQDGRRLAPPRGLDATRRQCRQNLSSLSAGYKHLRRPECYPVMISDYLARIQPAR